jgi:uncharacterized protein (TIGR02444 family)
VTDFWTWAVKAYGRPGAAEASLALQDQYGQSVPYLLWAAWAAETGRPLDAARLAEGADLAALCHRAAIDPLREVRRALKPPFEGVDEQAKTALREQVKAVELAAERVLMEALEALAPASSGAPLPRLSSLEAAVSAWSAPAPAQEIHTLALKLS